MEKERENIENGSEAAEKTGETGIGQQSGEPESTADSSATQQANAREAEDAAESGAEAVNAAGAGSTEETGSDGAAATGRAVQDIAAVQAADTAVTGGAGAAAPAEQKKKGSEVFAWIRDIIIAIVIALIIYQFITPTIVQEHSMENTLFNDDYLILWKLPYKLGQEPNYGDIVVFRSDLQTDTGKDKLLIKRVIAKGGDTVAVSDGIVFRNGDPLDEPYTKDGYTTGGMDETTVPDGELFVLGDNRVVSVDSRSPEVGFVDEDRLVGKAVFRLYPFNEIGTLYGNYPGNN